MFVPVAIAVFLTLCLVMVVGTFLHDFGEAGREDSRWAEARCELGKGAEEIAGLDTRLFRPWGISAAGPAFALTASRLGHEWLAPVAVRMNASVPLGIRAVAGDVAGTKVAFLVARTRRVGMIARRLALGPSGVVEEEAPASEAPPEGFVRDLEALARRLLGGGWEGGPPTPTLPPLRGGREN
ncbi:MAG TPA: hypothetical protein VFF73_09220 [Planctomycetota bacterium]|nr:hypothetical protein [Planctomycetota bacterium]